MPRYFVVLGLTTLVCLPAIAGKWSPPAKSKITWPGRFDAPRLKTERIRDNDDMVCEYGKSGGHRYLYAAKARPRGFDMKKAADFADDDAKFDVFDDVSKTAARFKRGGGAVAWVSFSIRAMETEMEMKADKKKVELYYKLEIPLTTITTAKDWQKICEEAADIVDAGA